MTPAAFQHLLITHAPEVPGITAAARRDDCPYGLTVTLAGGRVWWTITGTSPTAGSGEPARHDSADPVPVPDLTGQPVPVADVEQALIATAITCAPGDICHAGRYSTRPSPPAVRYGATVSSRDGWKLYLSCYGTTRHGQLHPDQPYQPGSSI